MNTIDYLKYSQSTLPENINEMFRLMGYNEKGRLHLPFTTHYSFKDDTGVSYGCFILEREFKGLELMIRNNELHDENFVLITDEMIENYLASYAKGFNKGYSDFINKLQESELIKLDNNDLVYRVFESMYGRLAGMNTLNSYMFNYTTEKKYITHELFFDQGIRGGEFYKAWGLVLSTPLKFENYFNERFKKWFRNDRADSDKDIPKELDSPKSLSVESRCFKTKLSEVERLELCDRIIKNKGAENNNQAIIFKNITEEHKPTILYLFGGIKPNRITPIKINSHRKVYELLLSISDEPHPYKKIMCVPDFMKSKICPELLLEKKGKTFDSLRI